MPTARTVDQLRALHRRRPRHSVPTQITIFADGTPVRTLPVPTCREPRATVTAPNAPSTSLRPGDRQGHPHSGRRRTGRAGPDPGPSRVPGAAAGVDHRGRHAGDSRRGCAGDHRLGVPQRSRARGRQRRSRSRWWGRAAMLAAVSTSSLRPQRGARRRCSTPCRPPSGARPASTVDRVVLSSDRAGTPAPVTPAGAPISDSGATVRITSSNADSYHLQRPHRRQAVLAGARREPERRLGGDGRRAVARYVRIW